MRNHIVKFVDDNALPDGMDWALAQDGDLNVVFIKSGADLGLALCEAWTVFHRNVTTVPEPAPVPRPRVGFRQRFGLVGVGLAAVAATAGAGADGLSSMEGFPLWSSTGATVTSQWLHLLQL